VEIAVDLIMYDGGYFEGRVSGTFPNFRMLVSARNPKMQSQQQLQQQQQQQKQANSWKILRSRIIN
jgi:phospholipase C